MKLKSLILSGAVLVFFLCTQGMAMAHTLTFTDGYGKYQTGLGGEFTATPSAGLNWLLNNYDSKVVAKTGTFQTFCMEFNEHISINTPYNAVLSNAATNGGVSGGGVNKSDPLSIGTAYLYDQFAKGALAGYEYNTSGINESGREASAAALQNTIWWLEGEQGKPNNSFVDLVISQFKGETNAMLDNNGSFAVRVVNLIAKDGTASQDQLAAVPIPSALYLLAPGLLGLIGFKRKYLG